MTGASLTLTDDEATPTVTLALSSSSVPESGGVSTVTASLNRASSAAVTLAVAATGVGFTLSSETTLTIASGETTSAGTVTLTAVADTTDGPDKSVLVSAPVSGDSGVSDPSSVTLTIADDDAAPTVELSVASSSIPENGGSTTVTATLSHASSAATTVTVTAASGFYTVGSDTTVVIAAGETSNATDSVTITAVGRRHRQHWQPERDGDGHGGQCLGRGRRDGAAPDIDGRRGRAGGDIGAFRLRRCRSRAAFRR